MNISRPLLAAALEGPLYAVFDKAPEEHRGALRSYMPNFFMVTDKLGIDPFRERFPIDFNDVDYCLRLRAAGYRVVYTPWARLLHHESASFGPRRQDLDAMAEIRRRWAAVIDNDPYYNPNLTRNFPDYRLDA